LTLNVPNVRHRNLHHEGVSRPGPAVAVGSQQTTSDSRGQSAAKAIGAAFQASPAPRVFTAQNGFETYFSKSYPIGKTEMVLAILSS
jgi:hypothetical protein